MKFSVLLCACAVFATGTATSSSTVKQVTLNVGDELPMSIQTAPHEEGSFGCYVETPTIDTIEFRPNNKGDPKKYHLRPYSSLNGCAVTVTITDGNDIGMWRLYYNLTDGSSNLDNNSNYYAVTVIGQDVPETTTEARPKEILPEQFFNTTIGTVHTITINVFDFVTTESCHIVTPYGDEYKISDEIYIPGLQYLKDSNVACGVEINVAENFVGEWTLFSRDTRFSRPIERRVPFTIYVEEHVIAYPEYVTIIEGKDLYVRLADATNLFDTCKIIAPGNIDAYTYEVDEHHKNECGFIVRNIKANYTGVWTIQYGKKIIYKAPISVDVISNEASVVESPESIVQWARDRSVDVEYGPQNAVYCKIVSPKGQIISEVFGKCRIVLDKASDDHNGTWALIIGTPGKVLTDLHLIAVTITDAVSTPKVTTRVASQSLQILLSCALPGSIQVSSCKFRDPSGRVLLAAQGVGEDRYVVHGVGVSLESNVSDSTCGLRIRNPVAEDIGIWRCALDTTNNLTYYGFLNVHSLTSSISDSVSVQMEPNVTASQSSVRGVEGESITMSCSAPAEIRYCYFRVRNGTIFNISPGTVSSSIEYVGAGFSAGECGIRFKSLQETDSGMWSCHVGLEHLSPELDTTFNVVVQKAMTVRHGMAGNNLIVEGQVYDRRALDYCRFVRRDGFGFTSDLLPERYTSQDSLSTGLCRLSIARPINLDYHPWTVAARIQGLEVEVYGSSNRVLPRSSYGRYMSLPYMTFVILLLSLTTLMVGLTLSSKSRREWTATRAAEFRNSFRFKKTPLPEQTKDNSTAIAA